MFKEISSQPVWTGGTIRNTNNSPYEHLSVALKQICNNLNRSFRANFFTIISVSIAPFPLQTDDTCCRKNKPQLRRLLLLRISRPLSLCQICPLSSQQNMIPNIIQSIKSILFPTTWYLMDSACFLFCFSEWMIPSNPQWFLSLFREEQEADLHSLVELLECSVGWNLTN